MPNRENVLRFDNITDFRKFGHGPTSDERPPIVRNRRDFGATRKKGRSEDFHMYLNSNVLSYVQHVLTSMINLITIKDWFIAIKQAIFIYEKNL